MQKLDFYIKMSDEANVLARSDRQNTREMELNEIYSTTRNAMKTEFSVYHFVVEVSVDNAMNF